MTSVEVTFATYQVHSASREWNESGTDLLLDILLDKEGDGFTLRRNALDIERLAELDHGRDPAGERGAGGGGLGGVAARIVRGRRAPAERVSHHHDCIQDGAYQTR